MSFITELLFGKPPPPPDNSAMASSNKEIAQMNLDYAREKDKALAGDKERILGLTEKATAQQMGIAQKESDRADSYYNDYQKTYQPVNQALARQASNYQSEGEQARLAGLAGADVAQGFANTEGQGLRARSRVGMGQPSAGAFAALNNDLMAKKALGIAGAETNARAQAMDKGTNMMTNVANIGNRLPGVSQTSNSIGLQGAGGAVNSANQSQGSFNTGYQIPGQYMTGAVNANNASANINNASFQNEFNNWATQGKMTSSLINAAGGVYGMSQPPTPRADGGGIGRVDGPGTGISDSIPARLSDGEYVIPADVVKRKGVEFFDKILEKHHMPAAQQRRQYGIGGR